MPLIIKSRPRTSVELPVAENIHHRLPNSVTPLVHSKVVIYSTSLHPFQLGLGVKERV